MKSALTTAFHPRTRRLATTSARFGDAVKRQGEMAFAPLSLFNFACFHSASPPSAPLFLLQPELALLVLHLSLSRHHKNNEASNGLKAHAHTKRQG